MLKIFVDVEQVLTMLPSLMSSKFNLSLTFHVSATVGCVAFLFIKPVSTRRPFIHWEHIFSNIDELNGDRGHGLVMEHDNAILPALMYLLTF